MLALLLTAHSYNTHSEKYFAGLLEHTDERQCRETIPIFRNCRHIPEKLKRHVLLSECLLRIMRQRGRGWNYGRDVRVKAPTKNMQFPPHSKSVLPTRLCALSAPREPGPEREPEPTRHAERDEMHVRVPRKLGCSVDCLVTEEERWEGRRKRQRGCDTRGNPYFDFQRKCCSVRRLDKRIAGLTGSQKA